MSCMICIPSTLIGVLAGALSVRKMGVELEQDPVYQERLASGELQEATNRRGAYGSAGSEMVGAAVPRRRGADHYTGLRAGVTPGFHGRRQAGEAQHGRLDLTGDAGAPPR